MPNGKPHDHPLTDILVHSIPVYGDEADTLIRRISGMCSHQELYEWWEHEIGWSGNEYSVVEKARLRLGQLLQRAKEGGWDI